MEIFGVIWLFRQDTKFFFFFNKKRSRSVLFKKAEFQCWIGIKEERFKKFLISYTVRQENLFHIYQRPILIKIKVFDFFFSCLRQAGMKEKVPGLEKKGRLVENSNLTWIKSTILNVFQYHQEMFVGSPEFARHLPRLWIFPFSCSAWA